RQIPSCPRSTPPSPSCAKNECHSTSGSVSSTSRAASCRATASIASATTSTFSCDTALLLQPCVFEGLRLIPIRIHTCDLAAPQRPDVGERHDDLDSITPLSVEGAD